MFKPLNQLNAIFDFIRDLNLSGNEQLVLFHLFDEFNRAYWTESLKLSDETLRLRLNQYDSTGKPITIETIRRAKQRLKSKGLIDFTSGKGSKVSEYKLVKLYKDCENLPCGHPANTPDNTSANTPDNTPDDLGLVSYTRAGEDVKTERQKDFPVVVEVARAHAREGEAGATEIAKPTPEIEVVPKKRVSDGVRHRWIQATYSNPTELDEEGLAALEKEYGSEKVFWAIVTANKYKKQDRINLALVETVLENSRKPQKERGEVRNGSRQNKQPADGERFSYRTQYDDL